MRARDLALPTPPLALTDAATTALRRLAEAGLPGLVVDRPPGYVVVPASQVLRVALPRYVLDDPSLARVWDEPSADRLAAALAGRSVADLVAALEEPELPEPVVAADATLVEIAAVMTAHHLPLVAVVERGRFLGVVTVAQVVGRLLA